MSEEVNEKTLLAREELAGHYKSIINLLGEISSYAKVC